MSDLTATQAKTLAYIVNEIRENQCPPTMMEISCGMGWSSANAAHEVVAALEKKGYIRRIKGRSRGIVVLHKEVSA